MKIYLGSDHAGFRLKESIKKFLIKNGFDFEDLGAFKLNKSDDYPIYAAKVARKVAETKSFGILFCGSAQGMCIAANKIKGIRAVAISSVEDARLTRLHNDANVLCLAGGGMIGKRRKSIHPNLAQKITKAFLTTMFSNEERHIRRINEIKRLE